MCSRSGILMLTNCHLFCCQIFDEIIEITGTLEESAFAPGMLRNFQHNNIVLSFFPKRKIQFFSLNIFELFYSILNITFAFEFLSIVFAIFKNLPNICWCDVDRLDKIRFIIRHTKFSAVRKKSGATLKDLRKCKRYEFINQHGDLIIGESRVFCKLLISDYVYHCLPLYEE